MMKSTLSVRRLRPLALLALFSFVTSCGDSTSSTAAAPNLFSVSPDSIAAGAPAFTLTAHGAGFVSASVVRWNGADRSTTFVSDSVLTASIDAASVASAREDSVSVFTPAPGGGTSGIALLMVANPVPSISTVDPANVIVDTTDVVVTVHGAHFVSTSKIRWNATDRTTTFVSDSVLTATIDSASIGPIGTDSVSVSSGPPGGGTSATVHVTVSNPPQLTWSLTPVSIPNPTWGAAVSSTDIAYLTHLSDNNITIMDVAANATSFGIAVGNWPYDVDFNSSSSTAYTANLDDSTISVINTSTAAQTTTYKVPSRPIRVRVGAGDANLYVTLIDGDVAVLNASNGSTAASPITVSGVLNGAAFTPDKSRLWVTNTTGLVAEINTSTNTLGRSFAMGGTPQDVAVSKDGTILYVANETGWVGVYKLTDLTRIDSLAAPGAFGLAVNPSGTQLWVSCSSAGLVRVFYTRQRIPAGTVNTAGKPRHLAFTSAGVALIANESGTAHIARQN